MLEITNKQKFDEVVSNAIEAAATKSPDERTAQRWINAIGRAAELAETQPEFITWMEDEKAVVVWSQETNQVYTANGVCQCRAFAQGQACKHRALAKLVRNYVEAETQVTAKEMDSAPYLRNTIERPAERIAGIRIN